MTPGQQEIARERERFGEALRVTGQRVVFTDVPDGLPLRRPRPDNPNRRIKRWLRRF